jgi:hypothetical protein
VEGLAGHTAKRRRVFVVHGGTREASGRRTRERRERLLRQCRQLGGPEGACVVDGRGGAAAMGGLLGSVGRSMT